MKKFLLTAVLMMAGVFGASAYITYSCVPEGAPEVAMGLTDATYYEVCMRVDDATLSNSQLIGVKFRLNVEPSQVKSCKVWLTRRLGNSVATTNESYAEIGDDGIAAAALAEPFRLTGANIYVGYTLELKSYQPDPIVVAEIPNEYGMFMRTHPEGDWERCGEKMSACIDVLFDGKFQEYGADFGYIDPIVVGLGQPSRMETTVINHGQNAISSIEYEYEIGQFKGTQTVDFPTPISYKYGSSAPISLDIPASEVFGSSAAKLKITKVNGHEVESTEASFLYSVVEFVPVHRPLMEEYTGTWCGNCPRGTAAMETLGEMYGDLFVGVALHFGNGDPMQILPDAAGASGYPQAQLDRTFKCDPYWGTYSGDDLSDHPLYINHDWNVQHNVFAPAAIDLKAEWADNTKMVVNVTSTTTFVVDPTGGSYRVGYMLVQDHLTPPADATLDSAWAQSNYYSNAGYESNGYANPWAEMPGMERFTELGEHYLEPYDRVAIYIPSFGGLLHSLDDVKANEPMDHSMELPLQQAVNIYGQNLVSDKNQLYVVAYIVNGAKNTIVNAIQCKVGESVTGVEDLNLAQEAGTVVAEEWFDINGMRLAAPAQKGLFLKVSRMADGTAKTEKIAF